MSQTPDPNWFEKLPKVELHVHLEGAIPYDALWELVQKYGGDETAPSLEMLKRKFEYRDFPHFIETWIWKNQFLCEYEDFTFIAEAVARDLADQNIRYAEVFFSPTGFVLQGGLETRRIAEAIRRGLDKIKAVEVALIADLVRDFGPDAGNTILSEINETKPLGVVGIGIGGSEQKYPPEAFEAVFARARELGFRLNAHAGEAAGPASIWGAIRRLKVDRIGHGTRAQEDKALLDYIVDKRIPVEVCPLSNVKTGVVESYETHPVRRYFERGMTMSINTDDPKMFGNSLAEEYRMLTEKQGFAKSEIKALILAGIETSWMPEEKKRQMTAAFCNNPAWRG